MSKIACVLLLLCLYCAPLFSQDSIPLLERIAGFPDKFFNRINKKASQLEEKIIADSERALRKLAKQEERLQRKLARKDSLEAVRLFGNVKEKYTSLQSDLSQNEKHFKAGEYLPHLDTLKTSLQFLSQPSSGLLLEVSEKAKSAGTALQSITDVQNRLRQADIIRKYIKERRAQLKERLNSYGLGKAFQKYNKQAYYYSQQIQEYKAILQDPDKLERKALGFLQKLPIFKKFLQEHSELAALFPMPDNYGSTAALQGLQTRTGVQQLIMQQTGTAGPNVQSMMQQNIQQAKLQFDQLKEKIGRAGGSNSDFDMPDFKPNSQKTKPFLKRIELGTNLQTTKSNSYWPVTSDIGLSVGYKLNDKGVIGIGGSYKVGWGRDIRHIVVTHEGIGIRSFIDWKLKGSFYISGGYEQNYRQRFENLQQLKGLDQWQESGLIGVSKIISLKTKFFKKTKMQLLWDFLNYNKGFKQEIFKFRVGYNVTN